MRDLIQVDINGWKVFVDLGRGYVYVGTVNQFLLRPTELMIRYLHRDSSPMEVSLGAIIWNPTVQAQPDEGIREIVFTRRQAAVTADVGLSPSLFNRATHVSIAKPLAPPEPYTIERYKLRYPAG